MFLCRITQIKSEIRESSIEPGVEQHFNDFEMYLFDGSIKTEVVAIKSEPLFTFDESSNESVFDSYFDNDHPTNLATNETPKLPPKAFTAPKKRNLVRY